jgi:transglutaminase-like putative cysteine protease
VPAEIHMPHHHHSLATRAAAPSRTHDVDCVLSYQVTGPTDFLFQIHALDGMDQQVLHESLQVTPALPTRLFADPSIRHRFLRLHADEGLVEIRYRARVRRAALALDPALPEAAIADLPDELLHNLMPTRYCESDLLSRAAQKLFGALAPGHPRVQAIADWIHANIEYQVGSSLPTTTARDVFVQRAGVCRDFAHLGVTFCRALNIPARLVVGYARFDEPPPDFHAVFEAYLGRQWVMYDPTRMAPPQSLVRIAVGRDAKDVAFATIFGPATMVTLAPQVEQVEEESPDRRSLRPELAFAQQPLRELG